MGRSRFHPSAFCSDTWNGMPLPGIPLVEVCNSRRVLIENHQGVLAYQEHEITIKVRKGKICVSGDHLKLLRMSREQLVISGVITAVCFRES